MPCQKRPPDGNCRGPEGTAYCCSVCRDIRQKTELTKRLATRTTFAEKSYTREVAQLCSGTLAQWTTNYTLSTSATGTVLDVRVAIHAAGLPHEAQPGDKVAMGATLSIKGGWASMIDALWSNKAQLVVPLYPDATSTRVTKTLTRNIVFKLECVDSAGTGVYEVACKKSKTSAEYLAYFDGLSDPERQALINFWKGSKPNLQAYSTTDPEWKKLQYLQDVPRDHSRHGTPHMGEWGDGDREAVQHEFGHAIGLPDEYNTTKYWIREASETNFTEVTLDASIYNLRPFSSHSLMNNTMSNTGSRLFPRHFDLLRKDFEDFARTNLAGGLHVRNGSCTVQFLT